MPHPKGAAHEMGDYNPQPTGPTNAWGRVARYALYPGGVRSKSDGQHHHVGPAVLANLYGVDLRDCMVVYEHELDEPWNKGRREQAAALPALRPRFDGNYTLPAGVRVPRTGATIDEANTALAVARTREEKLAACELLAAAAQAEVSRLRAAGVGGSAK